MRGCRPGPRTTGPGQRLLPFEGPPKMLRSTRGQNPALLSGRRGAVTADLEGAAVRDDPNPNPHI